MNSLKDNPRLITFLILIVTFIYCAHFTQCITSNLNTSPEVFSTRTVDASINNTNGSLSEAINDIAKQLSERVEHVIRQTSHLIGS